ncbi:MAG: hypothetical protein RRC34_15655 [Lentisphaeria bacterium]|nr:hypothetical protein [Lentisphaeria bacterium]
MKAKPQLDFETQLQAIPVRNESVNMTTDDDKPDALTAEVRLKYRGVMKLLAKLTYARESRRFELTGLAREIFERIDGKLTVERLVLTLAADEKLTFFEARGLINHYLRDLMQRGLIVILGGGAHPES